MARFQQVLDFGQVLHQAGELRLALHLVDDAGGGALRVGVRGLQRGIELRLRHQQRLDVAAERAAHLADRRGRRRRGHPKHHAALLLGRGQHGVGLGERERDHGGGATGDCMSGSTGLRVTTGCSCSFRMLS